MMRSQPGIVARRLLLATVATVAVGFGLGLAPEAACAQSTHAATSAGADTEPPSELRRVDATAGLPSDDEVRQAIEKGVDFLLESQLEDGSWGGTKNIMFPSYFANRATYHTWTVGTTALATLALMELGGDDARASAAIDRGLEFLIASADLKRPAEWDVDNNWGLVYGIRTLARALGDERFRGTDKEAAIREGATVMLDGLAKYQSARGGWGYYAMPDAAYRPDWATSFMTAVAVLGLVEAKDVGLPVDEKVLRSGVRAILRCRQPNGAYLYSVDALPRHLRMESINQVKGSLGRIQVCNYALLRAGEAIDADEIEEGVQEFFRHHKFLDVARNKPIPHEAYYANAAYFYLFGHYYAALAIDSLPEGNREEYAMRLRPEILKTQQDDGAMWDFWIAGSSKPYGTAFGIMALARTLR